MKLLKTLKEIEHKGPGECCILQDPSDSELFTASNETSHYIIIKSEKDRTPELGKMGWESLDRKCVSDGYKLYIPSHFKPRSAKHIWGVGNYHPFIIELADLLPDTIKSMDVGTYHGRSAALIVEECLALGKDICLYTVDKYDWEPGYKPHPTLNWHKNIEVWTHLGLNNYINSIWSEQSACVPLFQDGFLDHLHIDCNTDLTNIIQAWKSKLKPEAIVSGYGFNGQSKVIDKLFKHKQVRHQQNIWFANITDLK